MPRWENCCARYPRCGLEVAGKAADEAAGWWPGESDFSTRLISHMLCPESDETVEDSQWIQEDMDSERQDQGFSFVGTPGY